MPASLSRFQMAALLGAAALGLLLALAACNYPLPAPATIETEPASTAVSAAVTASPVAESATAVPSPEPTAKPPATDTSSNPGVLRTVFSDGDGLWLQDDAETPKQLLTEVALAEVKLTSDGQVVVFLLRDEQRGTAELWSVRSDGSSRQALLSQADLDGLYPLGDMLHRTIAHWELVPDSYTVLLNTRGIFEGPGLVKSDDLIAVDAGSGLRAELLAPGEGGDFSLSPDGSLIVLVRPDSIGFVGTEGNGLRSEVLRFTPVITYSEFAFYPKPRWAPDGSGVVVAIPAPDPFADPKTGTVWRVPADGSTALELARIQGDVFLPQGGSVLISPDLAQLALLADSAGGAGSDLLIARIGAGVETFYDTGSVQWWGWAPDSRRFAYSKDGDQELWIGEISRPPVLLGEGQNAGWLADGSLAWLTGAPGRWSIMRAEPGAAAEQVTFAESDRLLYDLEILNP